MTNYSSNSSHVRVEFFKPGGKWYMTEEWDMNGYYLSSSDHLTAPEAVHKMLSDSERGRKLLGQFIIVVLDPYHQFAVPVCLVPGKHGNE